MEVLVADSLFGFLQTSGLARSGGEAAALLMEGAVRINHVPARSPRTRLIPGDVVSLAGRRDTAVYGASPIL